MFESAKSIAHPFIGEFAWQRLARPRLTPGQIADKGRRSLRRLAEWGIEVPRNCRLIRSIGRLEEHHDNQRSFRKLDERTRQILGESARTVYELYIATHCGQPKPDDVGLRKFSEGICGADLPDQEEGHAARDIQFELYLWGLMHASGERCRFAEPDLIRSYGDAEVGIAAKRIWSLNQARKRLSEAAEQIGRSGLPGFIAINAQEYLTPEAGVSDLAVKGKAISESLRRLHGQLPPLTEKQHVLGLFIGGSIYSFHVSNDRDDAAVEVTSIHQWLFIANEGAEEETARRNSGGQEERFSEWMNANL
jgi:hypothetical protein